jgi:choline-sulfatase
MSSTPLCAMAPITPWDYQPLQKASERYMRNHMDLNVLEESQRFPRGE